MHKSIETGYTASQAWVEEYSAASTSMLTLSNIRSALNGLSHRWRALLLARIGSFLQGTGVSAHRVLESRRSGLCLFIKLFLPSTRSGLRVPLHNLPFPSIRTWIMIPTDEDALGVTTKLRRTRGCTTLSFRLFGQQEPSHQI